MKYYEMKNVSDTHNKHWAASKPTEWKKKHDYFKKKLFTVLFLCATNPIAIS